MIQILTITIPSVLLGLIFSFNVALAQENRDLIPTITLFPTVYYAGDEVLHLEGRARPSSNVELVFTSIDWQPKNFTIGSDASGKWIFIQKLFLEKGRWEVKARNISATNAEAVWSDAASFISVPTVFLLAGFKIKFSTFNVILLTSIFSFVIIVILSIFRYKSIQKQVKAFRMGSAESVIKDKLDDVRTEINEELWHLESKLKQQGSYTDEEHEHRLKLLEKLKKLEEEVEGKMMENL